MMPPRDDHKKLEAWVPRDLFDALTEWCVRNSVGSKTAWLEAAIRALLDAESTEPDNRSANYPIYTEMIAQAREIHARNTSGRRGGAGQ